MMKKVITVLISLLMILSLAACGNSASQTGQPSTEEKQTADTVNSEEPVENSANAENTDTSEGQTNESENPEEQGTKVLVAYFSATNTTQGIAEHIANGLNADIYEIVPEEPYTDADLNYNDNNSRTTIEMNDPDARPAITGSVEDMEQYDIVFIGYPIWWGRHRGLSVLSWRAMIFQERRLFHSALPAAVAWVLPQQIWSSSQMEQTGFRESD